LWQEKRQEEIDQMNDLADKMLDKDAYKLEIKLDFNEDVLEHLG